MNRSGIVVFLSGLCLACDPATIPTPDAGAPMDAAEDTSAVSPPDAPRSDAPGDLMFVARCNYMNTFSMSAECREYEGAAGWSAALVEADCMRVFLGRAGTPALGVRCSVDNPVGVCAVGDPSALGYITISSGPASGCGAAQSACETFARGRFTPDARCAGCEATGEPPVGVFIPPYVDCRPARTGELPGLTDGEVCTPTLISGSTEPGRRYADYADCNVVRTQRPYYPFEVSVPVVPADPRLTDTTYMRDVAWLRTEAEASACACCHSASRTPDGASIWDTEAGPLWVDTVSDEALAMLGGFTDSGGFGFYPSAENNGFDRSNTGLPTTDVSRLRAFVLRELERRGVTETETRALAPFAPFFRDLINFSPLACDADVGVLADGTIAWRGGAARGLAVLEAGSASPGVPPNWDLPVGTIFAIAADPTMPAFGCGLRYGEVPEGGRQRIPLSGAAPALVAGRTYYLYVERDVIQPITRCTFVAQ